MSFDALESRANAAAIRRLANASAQIEGGEAIPIIFDSAFVSPFGGPVSASQPQFQALDSDLQKIDVSAGVRLVVRETDYIVRDVQPDGSGMSTVMMEKAA